MPQKNVVFNKGQPSERAAIVKTNKVGMKTTVVDGHEIYTGDMKDVNALQPMKDLIEAGVDMIYEHEKDNIVPYVQLFPPVKEIHDAFNKMIRVEPASSMKERWEKARDLICSFLNKDNAYRLRVQMFAVDFVDLEKLVLTDSEMKLLAQKIDVDEVIKIVENRKRAQQQQLKEETGNGGNP